MENRCETCNYGDIPGRFFLSSACSNCTSFQCWEPKPKPLKNDCDTCQWATRSSGLFNLCLTCVGSSNHLPKDEESSPDSNVEAVRQSMEKVILELTIDQLRVIQEILENNFNVVVAACDLYGVDPDKLNELINNAG